MALNSAISMSLLCVAVSFGTSALAQSQSPAAQRPPAAQAPSGPLEGQIVMQDTNTILARQQLIGQTVYAPDKAKVGSISDLLLSKDGKSVEGFVIGVGGFLGMGEKKVALKMDKLKMTSSPDGLQLALDMSKEELSKAPAFKSQQDQDAEKAAAQRKSEPRQRPTPGGSK
jgi:hypothetical protein